MLPLCYSAPSVYFCLDSKQNANELDLGLAQAKNTVLSSLPLKMKMTVFSSQVKIGANQTYDWQHWEAMLKANGDNVLMKHSLRDI